MSDSILQAAVGFEYEGKTDKHESQKGVVNWLYYSWIKIIMCTCRVRTMIFGMYSTDLLASGSSLFVWIL